MAAGMKSSPIDLLIVSFLLAAVVYSAVDLLTGASGLSRQAALRAELRAQETERAALIQQRDALEARSRRLIGHDFDPVFSAHTPIRIDADLLDAAVRARFGVGRADEVLLIAPAGL